MSSKAGVCYIGGWLVDKFDDVHRFVVHSHVHDLIYFCGRLEGNVESILQTLQRK